MKITREHLALIGVILFILGIEMVIIQRVVLNDTLSETIIRKFYPTQKALAFFVKDDTGTLTVKPLTVNVPDTIGHCVATSGFVLILCCLIANKPD